MHIFATSSAMFSGGLGTVAVLVTWLFQLLILTGVGMLPRRLITKSPPKFQDSAPIFWLGFSATILVLEIWHFWAPVDVRATVAIAMVGLWGIVMNHRFFSAAVKSLRDADVAFLIAAGLIVLWFANRAWAAPSAYDNGMYHIPVIRWNTSYAIVKGLGNLDGHFSFNNANLLYEAALEFGFWHGRSTHIANGPLLLVTVLYFLHLAWRRKPVGGSSHRMAIYPLVLLTPCVFLLLDPLFTISNPTPDLVAASLSFFISWLFLEQLEWGQFANFQKLDRDFRCFTLLVLCGIAPSIKLSTVFYAGTAGAVALLVWLRTDAVEPGTRRRVAVTALAFCAVATGVWCARTALLSGYPFFPSALFGLPVDWRIPQQHAEWFSWWIKTFARVPYNETISADGLAWLPYWIKVELRSAKIGGVLPLLILAAAGLAMLLRRRAPGSLRAFPASIWVPPLVGIAAWLVSAPSFRFGFAVIWIFAAQAACAAAWYLDGRTGRATWAGLCLMAALPILQLVHLRVQDHQTIPSAIRDTLFVLPGSDQGLHPYHRASLTSRVTRSGLRCAMPNKPCLRGDNTDWQDRVIWDAPIPATCFLFDSLSLRRPGDPASGFRITESPEAWVNENWEKVQAIQRTRHWNLRQTAFHFRVHPRYLQEALDRRKENALP